MPASQAQKQALAKEIRRVSRPSKKDRMPCAVCGKFEQITDGHHILTVEQIAATALEYNVALESVPMIWLCPTCHRAVHLASQGGDDALRDFQAAERYRLSALGELRRNWSLQLFNATEVREVTTDKGIVYRWERRRASLDELAFPVNRQNGEFGDGTEITADIFFMPIGFVIQWFLDKTQS